MAELPPAATMPKTILNHSMRREQDLLFCEFWPEVWHSEYLFEEDIGLHSRAWPFVKLIEHGHVCMVMSDRLDDCEPSEHAIHASFPVHIGRVVGWGLPVTHYIRCLVR